MTATSTLTLSAFLLARYGEWEALAREATPGPWVAVAGAWGDPSNGPDHMRVAVAPYETAHDAVARLEYDRQGGDDSAHIAANDPAFVLAQVASLRALIGLHGKQHTCRDGMILSVFDDERVCGNLLILAQPFRDHHDMRAEWVTG